MGLRGAKMDIEDHYCHANAETCKMKNESPFRKQPPSYFRQAQLIWFYGVFNKCLRDGLAAKNELGQAFLQLANAL